MSGGAERRPATILVVDDNEMNREIEKVHLESLGYAVVLAEDGERGIRVFSEVHPDLVLLDVMMPGINGFETCRRIRALPDGTETPIVFVTALAEVEAHREAIEAGADDFLSKPIQRTELLLRVQSLVRIRRLQRQKAGLTAFLVHDMKNSLQGFLLNSKMLAEDKNSPEEIRSLSAELLGSAEAMRRMVLDILDIGKSEDGMLKVEISEADLGEIVRKACESIRRQAEHRRMRLVAGVGLPVQGFRADADLLQRLLENLLDNSLKYAPEGGEIRIEYRKSDEDWIEIRVADFGPGVPPEFRDSIFDKYARVARKPEASDRASRGLGLAFCNLAAKAHGGRIWVEDNIPAGSVFCVRLPVGGPRRESSPQSGLGEDPRLSAGRSSAGKELILAPPPESGAGKRRAGKAGEGAGEKGGTP